MAGHHDPKLLFAIDGIRAYHIQDGREESLTPAGPQTLSLLMVPTNSPFADLGNAMSQNEAPDEDFYLHMNLPPSLDLAIPATTQIFHQPPTSYLIPRWDMGPDAGAFVRIEFPPMGKGITQDDIDTFETIIAQCTAFLERAPPPTPGHSTYNPADYASGGRYGVDEKGGGGQIVLIDEDDGSVVGELAGDAHIVEDAKLRPGDKDPVEVEVAPDGKTIAVRPVSEDYLRLARHPAYKDSNIVQHAATASRLIVTGSTYLGDMMMSRASKFIDTTKPTAKPLEFSPATHERVRKINNLTRGAASLSSKTIGQVAKHSQNVAARFAGHSKERARKGYDEKGRPLEAEEYRPGFLNKSLIAFSTIADGIAYSGTNLLNSGGAAASSVVGHRYGPEAGKIAANLAGGVKNVGLVYIDVTGVSRRAVIKSVAKGMVVGRVRGGGEVIVGGGDGGVVPEEDLRAAQGKSGVTNDNVGGFSNAYGPTGGEYNPAGFGNAAPPRYDEFGGRRKQG